MIHRSAARIVREALADTPVVLVHGPRQAGKSTLAQAVADELGGFRRLNLDDALPRARAVEDPTDFIETLAGPALIDEVQRAPGIFLPIKSSVDRDRRPGRFLLTGSSNILALPKLADSLAGRMAIIDLLPLSQGEVEGHSEPTFLDRLFDGEPIEFEGSGVPDLAERIVRGGFPEARARASSQRRDAWFEDYSRTLLERDVRDLANIEGLVQMPRVLRLLAARAGQTINVLSLARDTGIPNTSLHRYLDLLKGVFLLHFVPAWSDDRGTRLTRSPKAYLVDTGLLAYLDNVSIKSLASNRDELDLVAENFVAMELIKLAKTSGARVELHHLRTVKQLEVDFVLEARGGDVVGIEVKASPSIRPEDADGLKFLKELAGDRFRRGIVLYTGREVQPFGKDMIALPIDALWGL
ncbi:ATP-binding protein [Fimbriimonas ginsengisoli]|uniref:Putative ATPase n=1 Tax=Fimbriimonas ginsengisoli Gsoil 348 TaxID=661478 RepID=A0A068NPP9_FIMGI|nr:ATP-binding protein [Fimbriimonas ginsengisoli]AIE85523.1 putative ATPase [Fimbriimonas ginsengisoli Gsoil 348]